MDRSRIEVVATELDAAGCGVAPNVQLSGSGNQRTVAVPNLLPGERGEVQLEHQSRHRPHAWATLLRLIGEPSADRVQAVCPAFGECGGCAWQQLSYPAQLRAKQQRIATAFMSDPRTSTLPLPSVTASPQQLGYRNKGKYVVSEHREQLILGAYRPRSHTVVSTAGCKIVAPIIDEVAQWTRGVAQVAGLRAYSESKRQGDLRYVVIRSNRINDVLVTLVVVRSCPSDKLEQVGVALQKHPAVVGVIAVENNRTDGAILPSDAHIRLLSGIAVLSETVAEVPLNVGASEFLQVNVEQADRLYQRVAAMALQALRPLVDGASSRDLPQWRAVDLYAGVGGISFALAASGMAVTAIEIDPAAVNTLQATALKHKLPIVAHAGSAAQLTTLAGNAHVVVVNPPRKGLDDTTRAALLALLPPVLIYVSCGPTSLARDLVACLAAGYQVLETAAFDLMPHTAQVETVVAMRLTSSYR
jgi:23S rRNA (uracil1939-C5)-methyltransferase